MGILKNFIGQNKQNPQSHHSKNFNTTALTATGSHALQSEQILAATHADAINPVQHGNFHNLRSVGIETTPRYMTREESHHIRGKAKQITQAVAPTVAALRALSRVEKADAKVQKEFRKYQGAVADGELKKVRSNVSLGKKLHGQRSQYATLGAGIHQAEKQADQRVVQVQAEVAKFF